MDCPTTVHFSLFYIMHLIPASHESIDKLACQFETCKHVNLTICQEGQIPCSLLGSIRFWHGLFPLSVQSLSVQSLEADAEPDASGVMPCRISRITCTRLKALAEFSLAYIAVASS